MFGFLKKKPALKETIFAPVVLPETLGKSRENCLSDLGQYRYRITELHGYLPEEIAPAIRHALAVMTYLEALSEKGHGRYLAGVHRGEFDPALTTEALALIGAEELQSLHAKATDWLKMNAAGLSTTLPHAIENDDLKALDKQASADLRRSAFRHVVAMLSNDPAVELSGSDCFAKLQIAVEGHPMRDSVRLRQLEKSLFDPVVVGFRLALGWQTLKKDNALVQISNIRIGSRNHHPSDPNGVVYLVDSNFASLLGYQDRLGFHLAVSARKPGEPPINVLRPGDILCSASHEQVQDAIRFAKEDDIAFLAVALLGGYGLGKDISYLAFERRTQLEGLPIKAGRVYRVVAAKDSSAWLAIVGNGAAMLATADMRSTNVVFGLTSAQIAKLRREASASLH